MVIIGLLLIALVCLTLGLLMQSSVWLIASLIATAGAGFLLYKLRDAIAAPKQTSPARRAETGDATRANSGEATRANGTDATRANGGVGAGVGADTDPASPDVADDTGRAGAESMAEARGNGADEVWVIDGRPRYHLGDCAIIKGQDAESIPFEQATEDGFMPCSLCEPQAAHRR